MDGAGALWRRASVPAVEPWLPARRKKPFASCERVAALNFMENAPSPGGKLPPSTAGRDAPRHNFYPCPLVSIRG